DGEGLAQGSDRPLGRIAQQPVPVLEPRHGLVERAELLEGAAPHERAGAEAHIAGEEQAQIPILRLEERPRLRFRPLVAAERITAECDRAALAGSREEYALALQLGRQPLVVGIEKGDRFAAARANARIARGGGPAIALVA